MPKPHTIADRTFSVYKIHELARHIGKSSHTIRQWEKKGMIPPPLLDAFGRPRGGRRYIEEEVLIYREMVTRYKPRAGKEIPEDFICHLKAELETLRDNLLGGLRP